uniref:Uncharacterized protein n=1 Tax=Glossina austeni TaxID=7395 RepID=A0A1A9V8U6_GLOAU
MNDFDFDFQSIRQRYKGPEEKDLHLKIYEYGNDVLEFIFCYDFGLQIQTTTFLAKSNYFMAASSIHDIVINEVLENHLKPCGDCLHIIYKHLNKTMRKTCHE